MIAKILIIVSLFCVLTLRLFQHLALIQRFRATGGTHAPIIKTTYPGGLDYVFKTIRAFRSYQNYEFYLNLFKTYGHHSNSAGGSDGYTVEVSFIGTRFIFTADPRNIKTMLVDRFHDFGKGAEFLHNTSPYMGNSVFTADGQTWAECRALLKSQFSRQRVSDLRILEMESRNLLNQLESGGYGVDVTRLFHSYTMDVATHFLFGESINSVHRPDAELVFEAFETGQRIQALIWRAGPFKFLLRNHPAYRNSIKIIENFIQPYVSDALLLTDEELCAKTTDTNYTFLHSLASKNKSPKFIRDQLISIFFASRDTTASSLIWLFYHLSARPDIVAKLRAEILSTVGATSLLDYHTLKNKLPYLKWCVNETLRLYPIPPVNMRTALKDTTLPFGGGPDGNGPVAVLRGQSVIYSPLILHLREDLYEASLVEQNDKTDRKIPDIKEFEPERWATWKPNGPYYNPFSTGPRICLGQDYALVILSYTVVRILQKFNTVDRVEPRGEMKFRMEFTCSQRGSVKLGFRTAED